MNKIEFFEKKVYFLVKLETYWVMFYKDLKESLLPRKLRIGIQSKRIRAILKSFFVYQRRFFLPKIRNFYCGHIFVWCVFLEIFQCSKTKNSEFLFISCFFDIGSVSSYFLHLKIIINGRYEKPKKERQTFQPHMGALFSDIN